MSNKILLLLILCMLTKALSSLAEDNQISARFVPAASTATLSGSWSLWTNPSGLAFLDETEINAAYLYEFNQLGPSHHGTLNLATNLWNTLSLAGAINSKMADRGTDLSGIFGFGLSLTSTSSVGISFLKSHNFLTKKNSDTMISFGFQSRLTKYLAIGALYQEVQDGFFRAPVLEAGIGIRPVGEILTIGIDGRASPLGEYFGDGFRLDPIFSLKAQYAGVGLNLGAQILGLKHGLGRPIFSAGLEFNFAHWGFSFAGFVNNSAKNYGVGTNIRASSAEWTSLSERSGLWVELDVDSDGSIEERRSNFSRFLPKEHSALGTLALLKRLKSDPVIQGVIIHINGFSFGDGRAQEWRNALVALRNTNKEVVVYLDQPSERDYYIATAANKIYMNKQSTISLTRFQKTLVYFADLLKKIGLKAEAIAAGKYKTAPRNLTNSRPGKEEIEVYSNILSDFYENFLDESAQARSIPKEKLREIFNHGEIIASDAQTLGLVDKALYKDEIINTLKESLKKPIEFFADYSQRVHKNNSWSPPKKVVIIPIEGEITDERVYPSIINIFGTKTGALDVTDEIEEAMNDPEVAGIIVRINSPGGSASAGASIQRALALASKQKPIVASMSDIAASAGYLIATGTNYIISERNTITGSIGVFSLYFSGEELAKKIGVNSTELKAIKEPGPTYFHKLSPAQKLEAQKLVDWAYQNFISQVATGLDLEEEYIRKYADGRVWLGHEAFSRKLVQEIGGFADALNTVRELAKIPESEELILQIHKPGTSEIFSFSSLLASFFKSEHAQKEIVELGALAQPYIKAIDAYRLNGVVQARMPINIVWE